MMSNHLPVHLHAVYLIHLYKINECSVIFVNDTSTITISFLFLFSLFQEELDSEEEGIRKKAEQ